MTHQTGWPIRLDHDFAAIWERVAPYTMTTPERSYALWQAVNYIIDNNIPGSFVECGVWKGGSSMLIALALMARGARRNLFLFDTFDGMTAPATVDQDLHGLSAQELMQGRHGDRLAELVTARETLHDVRVAMNSTGYDPRLVYYVPGDVCETLAKTQTLQIALLRLDTDFYNSTSAELEQLYPRVRRGGVVIIDDYGHWRGARKAVDDYFDDPSNQSKLPMLWPIDYTGRGFVKQEDCARVEVERYDYVPPHMNDPKLLSLFPFATPINPWSVKWPYLRPAAPHIFRSDTRNKKGFHIGNASYEEAVCLYQIARQFAGKRGLEIGTHFGWTGAHLRAAGLKMDYIDPEFADPVRVVAVDEVMRALPTGAGYRMWPLSSPSSVDEVRAASAEPWSFVFIDGDHDGEAPKRDAQSVLPHCANDAIVMFHDMTSPCVALGLEVFREAGWSVRLYNTMQVLGIAWRGNVSLPLHVKDPSVPYLFHSHLREYETS